LHAADVTVVDQTGRALTAKASGSASSSILHLQQSVENAYRKQIIQMLSPLVGGARNLRVVVDANIDLSHHQESSITYGMGHVVTAAVLSSADKGEMSSGAFGIPGALSNQPPGAPQAPITAGATSTPALTLAEIKAMMPASSKDQQHFRYVLDKTVGFRKDAPWRLSSLSVSVLVNGHETTVAAAQVKKRVAPVSPTRSAKKTSVGKPVVPMVLHQRTFTPKTMQALQAMVSSAIHASAPQGTVNVTAMPFEPAPMPTRPAWWQGISPWAIWDQVEWFLLGLIALFLLRKPIKGLITIWSNASHAVEPTAQAGGPSSVPSDTDSVSDAQESGLLATPPDLSDGGIMLNLTGVSEGHLEGNMNIIKNLIRSDTTRAVEVIREWIGNSGEGENNG
jgi:flagellar M-ring protein FliF